MSPLYWVIQGIGIDAEQIRPYLDQNKLLNLLKKLLPDNEEIAGLVKSHNEYGACPNFDIDDFLYGTPFDNLADLLTYCDDTDTITYDSDGDGGYYFYYPPSMPWDRWKNEPNSIEEVHQRIIAAVKAVTTLSKSEIDEMIDDGLYVVGVG